MERWSTPQVCAHYDRLQPHSHEISSPVERVFTRPSLLWEQDCAQSGVASSVSLACRLMMDGWSWPQIGQYLAIFDVQTWSQHFYSLTGWTPQEWQKRFGNLSSDL
ncbi:MAG: hypothetical protein MI717_03500 [Spirochaetales bacterium]|nr:hypothetical protein [Spirochaetales bacterium]